MRRLVAALTLGGLLLATACNRIIVPRGEPGERAKAHQAEGVYAQPITKRPLPDLAQSAPLPQVLVYAFNSNGEIEAAYREWRAALERVTQAGALADPKLSFSFLFDAANLTSFSGILNSIRVMGSQELPAKGKREAKAGQALALAKSAGEKFRAAKFGLQKKVIQAYADLALNRALQHQTSNTLRLLNQAREVALHRYHLGGAETLSDLKKLDVAIQTAESDQRALTLQQQGQAATLNGLLGRAPQAPLGLITLPPVTLPTAPDAELFARAVRANPDLAALRQEIDARGAGQVLAQLEKKPDYAISGGLENPIMPIISGEITLPINKQRIHAGIEEALAMRQAAEARLRGAQFDTQARVVMALAAWRDAERILDNYGDRIIPKTRELLDTQLTTYGSGGGEFLDILDTQRLLVDFQKLMLQAEANRLRAAADLAEVIGEDLFQFQPTSQAVSPATQGNQP